MRFIDLEQLRPNVAHLLPALVEAQQAVLAETDPERRAELIKHFRPRWVALRDAFAAFSYNKCWYVECRNLGTDDDIDHFRPKLGVTEDESHPGYYWLAFDWTNLRLSCHRANRPRRNPDTGETGGKAGHFPLVAPSIRARSAADDLRLEIPALLDPTNPTDPVMLTFLPNGETAVAPEHSDDPVAKAKVDASRVLLHLDWPQFRDARLVLYRRIERTVNRGSSAVPPGAEINAHTSEAFKNAIRDLLNAMQPAEEYSRAARTFVESFRHVWWVERYVLRHAA